MNLAHRWVCNSHLWRRLVRTKLIPWVLGDVILGEKILELGPGPGLTTECLQALVTDLTCIEIHPQYASSLARRISNEHVRVIAGDAARMPMADANFDAVVCFTMLHHVPSISTQDALLREVIRVLRPGGVFAGSDAVSSAPFRLFHVFDHIEPVNPANFPGRLRAAGFEDIHVDTVGRNFRFNAHKPAGKISSGGQIAMELGPGVPSSCGA